MSGALPASFDALRPAIKQRWESLMRATPAAPPAGTHIITPEMMIFMLDDSLARLGAKLGKPAADDPGPLRDLLPAGPERAGCPCGLHLLLNYYLMGAQALEEILPAEPAAARDGVLRTFNRMAHDEVAALCGICRHRGAATCSLPAGWTGRPS